MNCAVQNRLEEACDGAGRMFASLAVPFVRYVAENAKHPVKLALRGAEPFAHAALKLERLGVPGFEACRDWQSVYITREIVSKLDIPAWIDRQKNSAVDVIGMDAQLAAAYLILSGLDKPYTLVDTGFSGAMARNLGPLGPAQSLFFVSKNDAVQNFVREGDGIYDAFCRAIGVSPEMDYMLDDAAWNGKKARIVNLLDSAPKLLTSPEYVVEEEDGFVVPAFKNAPDRILPLYKAFYGGMDSELDSFAATGRIAPAAKTIELLFKDMLISDIMHMFEEVARPVDMPESQLASETNCLATRIVGALRQR
jgi:hypothetical protein